MCRLLSCIERRASRDVRDEDESIGGERLRCAGTGVCGKLSGVGVGLKKISMSGLCSDCVNGSAKGSVYGVWYAGAEGAVDVGERQAVGRAVRDSSDKWFGGRQGRNEGGRRAASGREGRCTSVAWASARRGSSHRASFNAEMCEEDEVGESEYSKGVPGRDCVGIRDCN